MRVFYEGLDAVAMAVCEAAVLFILYDALFEYALHEVFMFSCCYYM